MITGQINFPYNQGVTGDSLLQLTGYLELNEIKFIPILTGHHYLSM